MYLDLAKFEAGKMAFRRIPVDLRTLVDAPVESARVAAAQHGISLEVEKGEIPIAELDPEKMVKDGLSAPLHPGAVKYYKEAGVM